MSEFKIGCSPLTGAIYAGNVSKTGLWSTNKKDVTDTAPLSVAMHLIIKDEQIKFNYKGGEYLLKVVKL